MNNNSQMTLRRALTLAELACEHIYATSTAPDKTEWCAAARLIQSLLDETREPVDDWFLSAPLRKRIATGRHKSEYER